MFENISAPIGDDLLYSGVCLGETLRKNGHRINTIDMDNLNNFDAIVFFDFPTLKNKYFRQLIKNKFNNLYFVIFESCLHRPDNYDINNHSYFKKIFTWYDPFVDNKKYIKINFSHKRPEYLNCNLKEKNGLCSMIVSNKYIRHPLELYTERVKAIRWFEKNHPHDFDLYGVGWDEYNFSGPKIIRALNKIRPLKKMFATYYPSYRGKVLRKRDVLRKYKFSICYENARDIQGYITEKIFDSFFAGCVPVYLGAPNIADQVPVDTFIDKRNFETYDELYNYLKDVSDEQYLKYIDAIRKFIFGKEFYPFSPKCFVDTIINEIIKKISNK